MAWRFKASKYKNAVPIVPKFEELIRDVSVGSYMSHGNYIAASAAYFAFNWDIHGSNLAVLPINTQGRQIKANVPLLYAHADFVTDFAFSPFDDGLLATGSQDSTIKLWRIPEDGMPPQGINTPELTLTEQERRIETLNFSPTADCILASSSNDTLTLWDLIMAEELYAFDGHEDEVQSVGWQTNGSLLATQCKDKMLRVIDPRSSDAALQCDSHQGAKDSKVVWLADCQRVLTTGFGSDRAREITIRDIRCLDKRQAHLSLDISSGILVPLYDADTGMCFLSGKGDRNIQFVEITNNDPFVVEGLRHSGDQTKGACLVPKRAMDVMQGEVNRILQLCESSVVPITWQVPRKTYREYHADIYPETNGYNAAMGPEDWWSSKYNKPVPKLNLDPKKRPKADLRHFQHEPINKRKPSIKLDVGACSEDNKNPNVESKIVLHPLKANEENENKKIQMAPPRSSGGDKSAHLVPKSETGGSSPRPKSKQFGRVSKFKHLKGDVALKGKFDNLKNLSRSVPAECNYIHANVDRIAIPLSGPGGKIAVFEASKPGRIPDGVLPVLIHGTTVMDFAFDPFDNTRLLAGCDDGFIRGWNIPDDGLVAPTNEPDLKFLAHSERVQIVKFHPLAKNILLTSAFDRTVKVWDLLDFEEPKYELQGHTEQAFSLDWSQSGQLIASVCKDGRVRIYEPLGATGCTPKLEGGDIVVKKGARVVWVLEDQYLIVTGFSRQSERQVMVYRASDLQEVHTVPLDVSPTILVPYYDQDSNTLFVTGKGESTVTTFEVSTEAPHLFPLSPYRPSGLHQGFAFLSKHMCNVRDVEFARAFRLTDNTIEPISFTVPRIRTAYFQDDLFPPTKILWEPTMMSDEWLSGSQKQPQRLNLQPDDMKSVSGTRSSGQSQNAPTSAQPTSSLDRFSAKQTASDIKESVSSIMTFTTSLEQDKMEGVDAKEWDD